METTAMLILKVSASLVIFYTAFLIIFRNDTNFRIHRIYLLSAIFLSVFLGFNNYSLRKAPQQNQAIQHEISTKVPEIENIGSQAITQAEIIKTKNLDYQRILTWLYISVASLLLIRIAMGFIKLLLILSSAEKSQVHGTRIYLSKKINGSTNILGFIFLNPSYLNNPKISQIIIHENIHASQYHSIDVLLVELLAAALWFNPVVWFLRRTLQQTHEYLADEGVLRSGVNRLDYQETLINHIAEDSLVLSSDFKSSIKKRFFMMTKTNEAYQTRSKILILLPLTTILIAGISLINAPAQEKQPVEQNKQVKFVTPQNSTKSSKTNAAKQQPQVKFVPPVNQATEETSQYPPKASVSLTRMNVLYIGVDNPVTIAVANYNPREIKVTFDNGELKKLDNSNYNYIARPKSAGSANLFIYAGEKLIEKAVFRVKPVPDPVAQVAGRKGGEIDREILASQNEIDVVLQNFDFDMQFKITEFTLSVSKDGRSYDIHSNSNKITQEQKELIMNTTQDQKVYFLDIKCTGPDEQVRELLPVVFKIK